MRQHGADHGARLDPAGDAKEQYELSQAVSEAGTSSIDLIRALEQHLKKYPGIEAARGYRKRLLKSATELNDNARIVLYGERVLQREPPPDEGDVMQMLDRVIRALVDKSDPERPSAPSRMRNDMKTTSPSCG